MPRLSRRSRLLVVAILVTLLAPALLLIQARPAAALDAGFQDDLVTGVASPTAIAFTPDGRLLIATQPGQLRVYQGGALVATPAIDLATARSICTNTERGLLGVAVDPNFASNHYIYLYYTVKTGAGCNGVLAANRVSRFTLSDGNSAGSEQILIDNIPNPGGNHNGGELGFGKDGYLYIGVGDGGSTPATAQQRSILTGKILRIAPDGSIPPTNPYVGADSVRCNQTGSTGDPNKICQEIYAYGLRNPFRVAFDPNAADTRFFINDVGQSTWEEIDLGQAGANYGWAVREGHCANGSTSDCGAPPAGMTNPIFDYGRSDGCGAIIGGAFVPNGLWPAAYTGTYLFSDLNCGKIFLLRQTSPGTWARSDFGAGAAVDMRFGPLGASQALYYATYDNGGQIRRISYGGVVFSDVPANHPAYTAITELANRGIIQGYGDGRFGPDDISLRAQMAAMIVRAMGWSGETHTNPFPDRGSVDDELWADVATLAARNVALGYEDGTYNPTGAVLHLQVISFISRAMVAKGLWTAATTDDPTIYPNVQVALKDRLDLVAYVQNAGAIPDRPEHGNWPDWNTAASRGWFAQVLWQALMP
jgi:glucose/arabinose dehydrogenase